MAEAMLSIKDWNGAAGRIKIDSEGRIHSNAVAKKIVNGKPVVIE
jgi:hypothetical protein